MNQVGNAVIHNAKRRLLVGCLSLLIGLPTMAGCLLLIFTVLFPALDAMAAGSSANSNTMMLVIFGLGLAILVVIIAVPILAGFFIIRRRARILDAIFNPLGFAGKPYMLYGRHYQGQWGGRAVDIYIYRGPTLEMRLSANANTRVQIMPKNSLPVAVAGIMKNPPMTNHSFALSPYSIFPLDEAWTRRLLGDGQVTEAIVTLMTHSADWALFRHVEIQPDQVLLFIHRSKPLFVNLNQLHNVQPWLQALLMLAEAVDAQPEPEIRAQAIVSTSREARQKRSKFLVLAILSIIIIMPLCFIALGVAVYLLASLN